MQDHIPLKLQNPILNYDIDESLNDMVVINKELSDYPTIKFQETDNVNMKTSLSGNEMYQIYNKVLNVNEVNVMVEVDYILINDKMISLVSKLLNSNDFGDESKDFIERIHNHIILLGKYENLLGKLSTVEDSVKKQRLMIFYKKILNFIDVLQDIESDLYFKLCEEMDFVDNINICNTKDSFNYLT